MSDAANMHEVERDAEKQREMYQSRHVKEYPDVSRMQYEEPPVVKVHPKKLSFVHNAIANKSKTNDAHLERTLALTSPKRVQILQALHQNSIEFKIMTGLKNSLFESELLIDNHLLPLEEWKRIVGYITKNMLDNVEPILREEIITKDGKNVNLQKLMDIIDLFTLLPLKKITEPNASSDIYFVLTSGTRGRFSTEQVDSTGDLKRVLDLLWIKLDERFRTMGEAFRYFDRNFNNSVSFGEF